MNISQKSVNHLMALSAETISNAKSGHTGSALGASSILFALFHDHLKFDPTDDKWINRDRFVMSAGHASALLYSTLFMFGYPISSNDLKTFRTCGSKTPGHPEYGVTSGVETTTGPLGQGVANAVGMAIAESMLEARFGEDIINHHTYCYAGDGCLMEGVAMEACSLAGTLKLNKLVLLYDDNNITIDGTRTLANAEDVAAKFEAMGWRVLTEKNGNNVEACSKAISKAKQKSDKPTIVIFKTTIGIGTKKAGTNGAHAYPLSAEEVEELKAKLDVKTSFEIPQEIHDYAQKAVDKNIQIHQAWQNHLNNLKMQNSSKYNEFNAFFKQNKANYAKILKTLNSSDDMAGRDVSKIVLNEISKNLNNLVGGTADLAPSTKAYIDEGGDFGENNRLGKNVHFGIREHAMGSAANGMALHSNFLVFDSTFLAFSNYMLPSIRMRSMMQIPVLSIFTHDSIDIGEDGPTHQPVEQLSILRQTVGLTVFRPGTNAEVVAGYKYFVENKKPTALILTKSKLSKFENSTIDNAEHGGYVLFETKTKPTIEIFATGRELALATEVAKNLEAFGVRVISVPCESLFEKEDEKYKKSVLLKNPKLKVAIEASNDNLWHKYVGENGLIFGVSAYQTSGKGSEVYKNAGFDAKQIASAITKAYKKIK